MIAILGKVLTTRVVEFGMAINSCYKSREIHMKALHLHDY